jgi:hypothetical protein
MSDIIHLNRGLAAKRAEELEMASATLAWALKQADLASANAGLGPIPARLFRASLELHQWLEERCAEFAEAAYGPAEIDPFLASPAPPRGDRWRRRLMFLRWSR